LYQIYPLQLEFYPSQLNKKISKTTLSLNFNFIFIFNSFPNVVIYKVGEFLKNKSIPRMKFIGFEGWGGKKKNLRTQN
jgi:hypothetical protein